MNRYEINKNRVSLKFKEDDQEHQEVVNLLKQLGRKKSQFIAICVQEYLDNHDYLSLEDIKKELGTGEFAKSNMSTKNDFLDEDDLPEIPSFDEVLEEDDIDDEDTSSVEDNSIDENDIPEIPSFDSQTIEETKPKNKNTQESKKESLSNENKKDLLDALDMFSN